MENETKDEGLTIEKTEKPKRAYVKKRAEECSWLKTKEARLLTADPEVDLIVTSWVTGCGFKPDVLGEPSVLSCGSVFSGVEVFCSCCGVARRFNSNGGVPTDE